MSSRCALCNRELKNLDNMILTDFGTVGGECYKKLASDRKILKDEWEILKPSTKDKLLETAGADKLVSTLQTSYNYDLLYEQMSSKDFVKSRVMRNDLFPDVPAEKARPLISGKTEVKEITEYRHDLIDKDIDITAAQLGIEEAGPMDVTIVSISEKEKEDVFGKNVLGQNGNGLRNHASPFNQDTKNWDGDDSKDPISVLEVPISEVKPALNIVGKNHRGDIKAFKLLQRELSTREWLRVDYDDSVFKEMDVLLEEGVLDKSSHQLLVQAMTEAKQRLEKEKSFIYLGSDAKTNPNPNTIDLTSPIIGAEALKKIENTDNAVISQQRSVEDLVPSIKHLTADISERSIKDHSSDLMFLAHATEELNKKGVFAVVMQYQDPEMVTNVLQPKSLTEEEIKSMGGKDFLYWKPKIFLVKKPHDGFVSQYAPASASLAINLLEERGAISRADEYDYKVLTTGFTSVQLGQNGENVFEAPNTKQDNQFEAVPSAELFSIKSAFNMSAPHDNKIHKMTTKIAFMLKVDAEKNKTLPSNIWQYSSKPCFGFHPARFASSIPETLVSDAFIKSPEFQNEFTEWYSNKNSNYFKEEVLEPNPTSFTDIVRNTVVKTGIASMGDLMMAERNDKRVVDQIILKKDRQALNESADAKLWKQNHLGYNEASSIIGHVATNILAKSKSENRHKFYGTLTKNLSERFDYMRYSATDQAISKTAISDVAGSYAAKHVDAMRYGYTALHSNDPASSIDEISEKAYAEKIKETNSGESAYARYGTTKANLRERFRDRKNSLGFLVTDASIDKLLPSANKIMPDGRKWTEGMDEILDKKKEIKLNTSRWLWVDSQKEGAPKILRDTIDYNLMKRADFVAAVDKAIKEHPERTRLGIEEATVEDIIQKAVKKVKEEEGE